MGAQEWWANVRGFLSFLSFSFFRSCSSLIFSSSFHDLLLVPFSFSTEASVPSYLTFPIYKKCPSHATIFISKNAFIYIHTHIPKSHTFPFFKNIPQVITSTFTPYLPPSTPLPKPLIPALLHRFSTSSGYALYPDILPFLHRVRTSKPDSPIIIGVVSNSDDRVPGILSSLGLRVGGVRWGMEGREVVGDVAGEENGNVEKEGEERHDTTSPKANNPPQPNDDNDDISFIALSYDINSEKPNRGIFNAARQLGEHCLLNHHHYHSPITINNNTCIHIGDDMEKDYKGAKNAGWDAVLLDRNRDWDGIEKGDESKVEEMGIGKGKVARASGLGDLVFY